MIGYHITSTEVNPYHNLALEEYLFRLCEKNGTPILYLWQNNNTIVIGRNQNAYTECNMRYVKKHHIHIARRLTGGGAVYHDLGNLNFTMIFPKHLYDIPRSTAVILTALRRIGVNAENNSRNDICIGGKKISGNAYYSTANAGMHHGTILYRVNTERLEHALAVSSDKLSKNGVTSVKSRVGDILSLYPKLDIASIRHSIKDVFADEYCLSDFSTLPIVETEFFHIREKYDTDEWNLKKIQDYAFSKRGQFSWGNATVSVQMEGETIVDVEISSDALDVDTIAYARNEWKHCIQAGNYHEHRTFHKYHSTKEEIFSNIEYLFLQCINQI